MKYQKLTKEQFEALAFEFSQFLATQKIDKNEWKQIKKENNNLTEELLCIFSDIVWNDVLTKTDYLEHYTSKILNLFYFDENNISRIILSSTEINFLETAITTDFLNNIKNLPIELYFGTKAYVKEKNEEIFDMILKGAIITKGEIYNALKDKI